MRSLATFNFLAIIFFRFSTLMCDSTLTAKLPPVVVLIFRLITALVAPAPIPAPVPLPVAIDVVVLLTEFLLLLLLLLVSVLRALFSAACAHKRSKRCASFARRTRPLGRAALLLLPLLLAFTLLLLLLLLVLPLELLLLLLLPHPAAFVVVVVAASLWTLASVAAVFAGFVVVDLSIIETHSHTIRENHTHTHTVRVRPTRIFVWYREYPKITGKKKERTHTKSATRKKCVENRVRAERCLLAERLRLRRLRLRQRRLWLWRWLRGCGVGWLVQSILYTHHTLCTLWHIRTRTHTETREI